MTRKQLVRVLVLALLAGSVSMTALVAAAARKPDTWSYHLSQLRRYALKVGVQVSELPSGRVLWEQSSRIPLVPASLTKVLTSYAALKTLGPYYKFETEIYADGRIVDGILHGKLVIKGGGDPYLVAKDVWQIAADLKTIGINKITDGIYVDDSFFQPEVEHLCIDRHCERGYNPVLSATALEYNTVQFRVFGGDAVGKPARVAWFPPTDYVMVSNTSTTIAGRKPSRLQVLSKGVQKNRRELFELKGPFRTGLPLGFEHRINVDDPVLFVARTFAEIMRETGIEVGSKFGAAKAGDQTTLLYTYKSVPLGDLLFGLNRYSNNFMAETLFRVVGADQRGAPATAAKGVRVVSTELQQLGAGNSEYSIDSGSGLSRTTRASARTFNLVLVSLYNDFDVAPEFVSSLARNGEEGTLRKRIRGGGRDIIVRGKTGTLADVVGFSGYIAAPSGKMFAATVILNDVKQRWEARRAIDNLLKSIPDLAAGGRG